MSSDRISVPDLKNNCNSRVVMVLCWWSTETKNA